MDVVSELSHYMCSVGFITSEHFIVACLMLKPITGSLSKHFVLFMWGFRSCGCVDLRSETDRSVPHPYVIGSSHLNFKGIVFFL